MQGMLVKSTKLAIEVFGDGAEELHRCLSVLPAHDVQIGGVGADAEVLLEFLLPLNSFSVVKG